MKKSTLLSLATAGAIVATSAFTFAAWDKMEGKATTSVTIRNPVTVTAPTETVNFTATDNYGDLSKNPEYKATATFKLAGVPSSGYKFNAETVVKNGVTSVPTDDLSVVTTVDNETVTADGDKTVTVTITPTDTENAKKLANQNLSVEITGKLVEDAPAS